MTIQITTLSNGLRIVTENISHVESISLGIWVNSGSRNESPSEHGIAHLLEHMAFKGTSTMTARNIVERIEGVGGEINASTSMETTAYYLRLLKDDIELGLSTLHSILTDAILDPAELDREKHVILQEIGAAQDSPDDQVFENFQSAAFTDMPLGRPIMGTPKTVMAHTADHIRQFMAKTYHAPNMVLSCAGAVDHEKLCAMAAQRFGGLSSKDGAAPEPAAYLGGEAVENSSLQEAQIMLGFEGRAYQAKDYYASQLLGMLLGGGMSSRLFQKVREQRGLCYSIYAFHWGFSDTGVFGIHAATEAADVSKLVKIVCEELQDVSRSVCNEELERSRAQIRAHLLMSNESPAARAAQNARQLLLNGSLISNEELMARLEAITPERLQDLASRMFNGENITLAALGPVHELPDRNEIAKLLRAG